MRFASVCSGIEAASVAWHPLGWDAAFFAEIAKFPSRVLAHRWPDVPNVGDFTSVEATTGHGPIDVLVGGTPCQSFSVAGRRAGMDDPRGHLAIEFLRIAKRIGARWLVWENVPGVLSSGRGRDFGAFLGLMVQCGYGFAYRVLDAQHFGIPQRRRRVFVVGYLGNCGRATAVLFERSSLQGDPVAGGAAGEESPAVAKVGIDVSHALTTSNMRFDPTIETLVFHASQEPISGTVSPALGASATMGVLTFDKRQITSAANRSRVAPGLPASTLAANSLLHVASPQAVRRLTPLEWERLQGFPDGYTAIPRATDAARYRALGNSMAVPVMRWIGERIARVDELASDVACGAA